MISLRIVLDKKRLAYIYDNEHKHYDIIFLIVRLRL